MNWINSTCVFFALSFLLEIRRFIQANLEKQVKELNVRIIDLETKSYVSSSRPPPTSRRMESRIEELTSQLNQTHKDKSRSVDKISRDAKFQAAESDRQRTKLEEERKAYEAQLQNLRKAMDTMVSRLRQAPSPSSFSDFCFQQTEETNLQSAKRRAEREAADFKQKALKFVSLFLFSQYLAYLYPIAVLKENLRGFTIGLNILPRVYWTLVHRESREFLFYTDTLHTS